mmetsp:Transcript_9566/g.27545  ORF Transcript_9566/g.27545 Transcript_9566/m.27545 type:complete len:138 (+) Transcript_9566:113-526(+)
MAATAFLAQLDGQAIAHTPAAIRSQMQSTLQDKPARFGWIANDDIADDLRENSSMRACELNPAGLDNLCPSCCYGNLRGSSLLVGQIALHFGIEVFRYQISQLAFVSVFNGTNHRRNNSFSFNRKLCRGKPQRRAGI